MTRETFERWTCNMCGTELETPTGVQPEGWVGYGFTQQSVPASSVQPLGHLCGDCAADVQRRIAGSRVETGSTTRGLTFNSEGVWCSTCKGPMHMTSAGAYACPGPVIHSIDVRAGNTRPVCEVSNWPGHQGRCRVKP